MTDIPVIYEDDDLLAINKPPSVVVNRAQSVKEDTLQDWVETHYPQITHGIHRQHPQYPEFISRSGIVHRIDKETSGCLLIAKHPQAFVALQSQFKERIIRKTYLALAHGAVVPPEGHIRAPVGRLPWNRERFGIVPGGKEAVTKYNVLSIITPRSSASGPGQPDGIFSVLALYPETGRTHQIRVHLKYINHPILGDYLYAGRKTSRDDRTRVHRVMLHAWRLSFTHPVTGQPLALEARVPDDIRTVIPEPERAVLDA